MRAPDLQPIAAGTAALLLVASISWWLLSAPAVIDPGQPSWKGADIVRITASVPQIDHFESFYVNDDNPFIPLQARLAENETRRRLREGPSVAKAPPRPVQTLPPRPPVEVREPEKPKLVLPKLSLTPANEPIVFGLVAADGQETLTVRMPGAKDSIRLVPGEKVDGWTLVSINNGNLAIFTDPQGLEQRFMIGQSDLAVAQNEGGTAAPGADPNAGKAPGGRGMIPKVPGGVRPPGPGGADGAIPKPPPREERRRPPKDMPKDPQGNPLVPVPVPPKK
jgi:hypothetical protein